MSCMVQQWASCRWHSLCWCSSASSCNCCARCSRSWLNCACNCCSALLDCDICSSRLCFSREIWHNRNTETGSNDSYRIPNPQRDGNCELWMTYIWVKVKQATVGKKVADILPKKSQKFGFKVIATTRTSK